MTLPEILKACERRPGASESALQALERRLGRPLPADYKGVLAWSDGLEGFVRDEAFIMLWSTSDLASLNDDYEVSEFVPGLTLIGTDGGDTGYGFQRVGDGVEYVSVPLVGMEPDAVVAHGKTFMELIAGM